MGSLGEAVLDLTADPSKLDAGLGEGKEKVSGALEGLKGTFGEATGTMLGMLSSQALQGIGQSVLSFGKDLMSSAMQAEQGMAQLEAVIKSTGGAAGITAEEANNLATALSEVTMFEDDTVLAAENMLLTFTNIKDDIFPQATKTVLDMSQALGQDATQSAMMLGKALNDPIAGVGALRRVGVQLTDEQEEMVKALVAVGDIAGAQAIILKELQVEFGGSAEAAGQTFAGQLKILENEFGNVKEELGASLMPVLMDFMGLVRQAMPFIKDFAKWFTELSPTIKVVVVAVVALLAGLGPIIGVVSGIIGVVTTLGPVLAGVAAFMTGPVGLAIMAVIAVLALLYAAWQNNLFGIRDAAAKVWPEIVAGWNSFTAGFKAGWTAFVTFISTAWKTLTTFLKTAWQQNWFGIRDVVTSVLNIIRGIAAAFMAALRGDWYAFGAALRQVWDNAWGLIANLFKSYVAVILTIAKTIVQNILSVFRIDWGQIGRGIIDGIVNGLRNGISAVIQAAVDVAAAALQAAMGFLGIHSPSTKFQEVADWSIEGFTGNMAKGLGKVAASAKGMAEAALGGVRAGMARGSGQQVEGSLGRVMRAGQSNSVSNNRSTSTQVTIINPTAEPASSSVDKTLRKLSYLGVVR